VNSAPTLATKKSKLMKPSQCEDLHLREHEMNVRMQKLRRKQAEATQTEKRFLKRLHWIRCPKCGMELTCERHGPVEIDLCPSCRGIWLDCTELETIVAAESGFLRSCLRTLRRRSVHNHQPIHEL